MTGCAGCRAPERGVGGEVGSGLGEQASGGASAEEEDEQKGAPHQNTTTSWASQTLGL